MTPSNDRDYVLGTHDEELARLGVQHSVWRQTVVSCWDAAGLVPGSKALDVGAGPGYATLDLSQRVGPAGEVVAVERSERFLNAARVRCESAGARNVQFHSLDLMTDAIPDSGFDLAWCRWVACFVASPQRLVRELARVVKRGGVAVFHEYADYATWRTLEKSPALEEFVRRVMQSWRDNGGEPDIARALPALLTSEGFRIESAVPRIFCIRPGDPMWEWPRTFVHANTARLLELGIIENDLARAVREEFARCEADAAGAMLTPLVLEIVAKRH